MIILTGASGGIGRGIVNSLSEIDSVLGIYNKTTPDSLDNDRIKFKNLDIENPDEVKSFVKKYSNQLSNITLVHCAASNVDGLAAQLTLQDWDRVIGANLRANFILTQALLPQMISDKWGRIIHISSRRGFDGAPGTIAYSTSKTGLIGMSNVLAQEYARFNISSNVLVLGIFEAGLFLELSETEKKKILEKVPSKKPGDPVDISNAIKFIINSGYVNASTINIDGGW